MPKATFFNLPDNKREKLIAAAIDEFSKAPYQEISINQIIKAMEIPAGSFYQYFTDKKDLYFYVLSLYIESLLDESVRKGKKLNILDPDSNRRGTGNFTETREKLPSYQSVFVDNFNKAPIELKREWTYERMLNEKFMLLYNYDFFEQEGIDPKVKEQKYLMMAMAMAVPSLLQLFCDKQKNDAEYRELYRFCLDVLKTGFREYRSPETQDSYALVP